MKVTGPPTLHIFLCKKPWTKKQVLECLEEFTVEVNDIIKKMGDHMPEGLFGNDIFLTAGLAIFTLDDGATIQAILFFSLWDMGQCKFWLKNKYKNIPVIQSFTLLPQNQVFLKFKAIVHQ
jgi:hypothetical protein